MPIASSIADLQRHARRRIPRWVYEYGAGGSYEERTLQANLAGFAKLRLQQRVLVDVSTRSMATTLAGQEASAPIAIAPTGLAGFFYPNGEIEAARAANSAGIPFCLSTVSICSIEEVHEAVPTPFWFQIYVMRDRPLTRALIERAHAAGCSALVVTLDLPVQARRHRDIHNGLTIPPRLSLASILDMARKPSWAAGILRAGKFTFGNFKGTPRAETDMTSFAQWVANSFDPAFTWNDIAWIRDLWRGKLILKGILGVEDARLAARAGADALVVSNHGGRQLDGAPSSAEVLPEIVDAVGDEIEILMDGGVRTGQDVLRALSLGARGCLLGRAALYGLAAGGCRGVQQAIEIIRRELDVSLALTGSTDVRTVSRSIIYRGPGRPLHAVQAAHLHAEREIA